MSCSRTSTLPSAASPPSTPSSPTRRNSKTLSCRRWRMFCRRLLNCTPIEQAASIPKKQRPVSLLFEEGLFSERCNYLSDDSVEDIMKEKHLAHLSDSINTRKRPSSNFNDAIIEL